MAYQKGSQSDDNWQAELDGHEASSPKSISEMDDTPRPHEADYANTRAELDGNWQVPEMQGAPR